MDQYRSKAWKLFREEVWRLHDYRCLRCDRGRPQVILQVHHKEYVRGQLPWDYLHSECETLCKGCHAKEHGIITPDADWELIGDDDLGALEGECEWCGTALRYVYFIMHPMWGNLEVGTDCCDRLTLSTEASERSKYRTARARWVASPKWSAEPAGEYRNHDGHFVFIEEERGSYRILINGIRGKKIATDRLEAKMHAYDSLNDPKVQSLLDSRRQRILRV